MSFVTESKTAQIPAGDRSFATTKKKKTIESDIPGYQQEVDDAGNPTDVYTTGESSGTRTTALQSIAKNEGVSATDEESLEKILAEVKDRKKKKSTPAPEGRVSRPGL